MKYLYWDFMNKVFGESNYGCYCTFREECRSCYTFWKRSDK